MSSSTLSVCIMNVFFFFFNDTATTEIYTLSLHDALPISLGPVNWTSSFTYTINRNKVVKLLKPTTLSNGLTISQRSEEHTSELQSRQYLVCRLLLEKKKIYAEHLTPELLPATHPNNAALN